MKPWTLALLIVGLAACGGGNDNNGENNGENDGSTTGDPDAGHEDASHEPDMGTPIATSGATGEVAGNAIDLEGVAIASVSTDGSFTILFADRDLSCESLSFAPGETYLRLRVTPDDGEFQPDFYNELVSSVEAEARTMPDGCAGEATLVGENDDVRPFTVILEEVTDETLAGTFDVELYVGLDNGSVAGSFEAVRCGMNLLPVCDPSL